MTPALLTPRPPAPAGATRAATQATHATTHAGQGATAAPHTAVAAVPVAAAPATAGPRAATGARSEGRAGRAGRPGDEAVTLCAMAARGGDPAAVEQFVRALQRDVRRYVTYLSADPQAADDLTQETFLRALGSLHRFEGRSSARTWLLSIARRTVIDSVRHVAARPRLSDTDDWLAAAERAQARGLPGFEDGIALAELLAQLPDERREAFVLTQLMGLPYAEAAQISRCPVGTVRSRVARARIALVALLRDAEGDSERPAEGSRVAAATAG